MEKITDEKLVRQIQLGDIEAFEILVKRYQERLLNFVFRIIRDGMKAEEVVQDTFLNLYKTIERVDTSKKFSSYLFQIAKNLSFSYLRKRKRELPLKEAIFLEDKGIYEKYFEFEDGSILKKAVSGLEEKYQKPLSLYYFEDLSYKKISRILAIPLNTVKTRIKRAKALLKERIKNGKN